MDIENTNTPEEAIEENQVEGVEAEADEDGWPTEWNDAATEDDGDEGEQDEVTPEADQPTEDPKPENENAEKPAETEPEQKQEEADQFLELKHMDEVRKVSREEAKTLAQKGLDYDRIRGERDAMLKDYQKLKQYEGFLNELKGDFPSVEAMMTDTRARMLAEKDGISYADAVAKVGVMQQGTPTRQQTQQPEGQDAKKNPAVEQFVQKYPNVKAEEIPQEVWTEVSRTGDLLGAYEHYQTDKAAKDRIAALEQEIETLKQNAKNAARSTGSATSSGKASSKSLYQQLWDEDDY